MIDTNKAREIAQALTSLYNTGDAWPFDDDVKEAAALLLALADAHDRDAKDAARYRHIAKGGCPFAETDDAWDSKESLDAAIDAAMGADQRGKE